MENDDNLKSVLLAAELRGRNHDVAQWVSKQKLEVDNILLCDRPDVNNQATQLMQDLLTLLVSEDPDYTAIRILYRRLRLAHLANWREFLGDIATRRHLSSTRQTVVSDAIQRISSNHKSVMSGRPSPVILSLVSAAPTSRSDASAPYAPNPRHTQLNGARVSVQNLIGCRSMMELSDVKTRLGNDSGVLYIKGFVETDSDHEFRDDCPLCGEEDALLTALLKAPPTDLVTSGFPSPGQRKGLVYPLAMGSYPETDVLSSYVCRDACAFTLTRKTMLLYGDQIIAAIPLIPSAFSGEFRGTTFDLIDNALQKRFHKSAVLLVFLAVAYNTIANIDGDATGIRSKHLKDIVRWVALNVTLPMQLSMSTTGATPRTGTFGDPRPLRLVISQSLLKIHNPESPLLQYPLGGFVVLALAAQDVAPKLENQRRVAVWHRFLYHLIEKHCTFIKADQDMAVATLEAIMQPSDTALLDHDALSESGSMTMAKNPGSLAATESDNGGIVSYITLRGTHLLSDEDSEEFERLGPAFEEVQKKCISALRPFLQQLSRETPKAVIAIDIFDIMRASDNLTDVFL